MTPSRIDVDSSGGVAIVSLVGEHEFYSSVPLERELDRAIQGGNGVVVDLTQAEFLDSAVVAILLRAREEAHVRGLKFALVMDDSTGWPVRQLFDVTGLATIFPTERSRDAAVAAMTGEGAG